MERKPQTLANHTRWDPKFHFFAMPLFVANFVMKVRELINGEVTYDGIWDAVFAFVLVIALFTMRLYSLKVQDRVIRLEERLRMQTLLPDGLRARIGELSESQIIGLRFAPDAEIPGLVEQALKSRIAAKEIKQAIKEWRPDYFRV